MRLSAKSATGIILLTLLCTTAKAQFSVTGSSPASAGWNRIETPNFRIIYPDQLDSLAIVYGRELETARLQVSLSSGLSIGQSYRGKMPVVLHPFIATSNGSVAWSPKRMDLYTVPDAYSPTPIPWIRELAIHEGRHAAQMQFGAGGIFRPVHYIVGEMFAGALAGIYPGPALLEGDAVATETSLSRSGRGRQASFLNYLMPAFDSGDWRDWWKWVYGSQKHYTPDYYRAGYILVAGARIFLDDPLFTHNYFDRTMRKGGLFNLQKTIRESSGMRFKDAFQHIENGFHSIWFSEALLRGQFMPSCQITAKPLRHSEYALTAKSSGSGFFAVKTGLTEPGKLVFIEYAGTEKNLRPFAARTSRLYPDSSGDRIYWTEAVPHWRWTMKSDSRIRFIESSNPKKIRNLTKSGKFYNSRPSPDGSLVAAIEYPLTGGSRLSIISASDGSRAESFIAADTLQLVEPVWIEEDGGPVEGSRLFVSGLSEAGTGIYEILGRGEDGKALIRTVLKPQPVEISNLNSWTEKNSISFISDRTGVGELYSTDTEGTEVFQLTQTRYGISDPVLSSAADTLFYASIASSQDPSTYRQGRMVYATAVADLPAKTVDFSRTHRYFVADVLSSQEKVLADIVGDKALGNLGETEFTAPSKYSKIRLPNIHSWAPVYFDYDNIESLSFDEYYRTASLGATALFQSLTGQGYGSVGYSAHKDPSDSKVWRHSGHLKYTWNGLLPAFEFEADYGERESIEIHRVQESSDGKHSIRNKGTQTGKPYLHTSLKTYIPIQLSSGGMSRGIVPQLRYSFTNDIWNDAFEFVENTGSGTGGPDGSSGGTDSDGRISEFRGEGKTSFLRTLAVSLRAYSVRPTASSQIFPSLGIGGETGWLTRPGHRRSFTDALYIYAYGYLPGAVRQHGIKLTATLEKNIAAASSLSFPMGAVSTLPRGFENSNFQRFLNFCSSSKFKASIDYAMPVFPVDWSFLCPVAYIRNFEFVPFCDFSSYRFTSSEDIRININGITDEKLLSVGFDFNVRLGNTLWLPYSTKIGIRYSRNFWNNLDSLPVSGLERNYVGLTYTIDM